MINKIITLIIIVSSSVLSAQNEGIRYEMDSLLQQKWMESLPKIDSLDKPKIIKINKKAKDSIIIHTAKIPAVSEQIPITPYNFMIMNNMEKHWFFFGQNNLVFNQASFSNWNAGGNNNIGIIAKTNYSLIYKNKKHFLENIFQLGYGLVATEGQSTRKTDDYINIQTNYGYELGKSYYLSTGMQFISQFARGYNYSATPNPNKSDRISQFLAPAYLNLGLGITYNPNENLQVVVRPLNGQFTFVGDTLLQKAGKYGLERDGQSFRAELGARVNVLHRIKLYKDIYYTQKLNLFTNYLSHIERIDIAYSGAINLKFNKYINANINIDLVYDHDQIQRLQRKQTLGIGLSYTLGIEENKKTNSRLLKPYVK